MDNTQSLSQSILQSSEVSQFPSLTADSVSSNGSGSGFFSSIMSINVTTWIIIILILAFLGFNIFVYFAKGTQTITDVFGPLFQSIFGTTAKVAGQTVGISAEGAKAVIGETAGALEGSLTELQQQVAPSTNKGQSIQQQKQQQQQQHNDPMEQSSLNQALNSAGEHPQDIESDKANSSIQGGGKAGWCYIGDDRGFRSCASVGVNDACMSGEIFPSHDICMNPGLRQ